MTNEKRKEYERTLHSVRTRIRQARLHGDFNEKGTYDENEKIRKYREEQAERHTPFNARPHRKVVSSPLLRNDFGGLGFGGYRMAPVVKPRAKNHHCNMCGMLH